MAKEARLYNRHKTVTAIIGSGKSGLNVKGLKLNVKRSKLKHSLKPYKKNVNSKRIKDPSVRLATRKLI